MHKNSFMTRLLIPVMIVLVLFAPLSWLIFSKAANMYAYDAAREDLSLLGQSLIPIMEESFGDSKSENQVSGFLSQIGPLMANTNGDARLMILGSRMQMIYPRDEKIREAVAPLSQKLKEIAENGEFPEVLEFDGEKYLLEVYETPRTIKQLHCIITYCPASQVGEWVNDAGVQVFIISAALAAAALIVILISVSAMKKSVRRLCSEVKRIGDGDFNVIERPFRTAELDELRLAINEMCTELRRSNESSKNFLQNVSHKLRNPLMSISGYAQGMEQGIFPEPQNAAHIVLEESTRLTETVDKLLKLSRMEADIDKAYASEARLIEPIESCIARMKGLALKEGKNIRLEPFDRDEKVYTDARLTEEILDNLISNAVRYAETAVTISVRFDEKYAAISVADDGHGIAENDLAHIFERGYKGDNGNFGIGLTIAMSAARKLGGDMTAKNSEQGGAVFEFTLPRQMQGGAN